jgi:hypothetical protein
MNRFIWAFAAIALVLIAVIGFVLLGPTAERPRDHQATDGTMQTTGKPAVSE